MSPSVIDQETLAVLDDLFGSREYLSELLPRLREQIESVESGLEAAISHKDGKAVVFHAHGLKSTSAQLGALRMSGVCQLLEALGKSPVWDEIKASLDVLKIEARIALSELANLESESHAA